ncbi:uncharacterized protein PG998_004167 [Apiospora kogelbergensis]|uniref:uncharacterized protein n=1 Tax=Apiospora kogelbergensis TaxID=1337665 RepID=UPI0031302E87
MRGSLHSTAALLLLPALATAAIIGNRDGPAAVVQLDLQHYVGNVLGDAHLQLDVLESAEPCGYGNVTLNGDQLPQDGEGRGSGPIIIDNGRIIVGDWHFDCVESGHRVEQLLRFNVVNIDGKPIEDVGFSSLFHQQYPVSITYVDGAESVINIPTIAEDKEDRKLEDEIVELARMKSQLLKLQERISLKEKLLSDEFGYVQGGSDHAGCGSFKCVFTSAWKKAHGRLSTYFHGHFSKSQHDIGRTKEHSVDEPTTEDYGGPIRVGDDSSFRGQQSQLFRQGNQRTSPEPTTMSTTPEKERRLTAFKWAVIISPVVIMILGILFSLLVYPFCAKSRAQRNACRQERHLHSPNRRALAREHRVATKAAMKAKFGELMRRFKETFAPRRLEDEEKEAILRRLHACSSSSTSNTDGSNNNNSPASMSYSISDSDDDASVSGSSDSDSDMSTTMEQDLASFRSVADVVGDMVRAAEEGRTRRVSGNPAAARHHHLHHHHQHLQRFTPSPAYYASSRSRRSTFSSDGGISIDEELPAYEEQPSRVSVDSASHVSNGIRYGSGYTPSDTSVTSSQLDEVLGRKIQR